MSLQKDSGKAGRPAILAPAGNEASFLAAVAAGADAVYAGLKEFSARMEAKNFTFQQLSGLADLARSEKRKVYITLNTMVRTEELEQAERTLQRLETEVRPDGIIIQDLAFLELANRVRFSGEIHLSTLANVGFGAALDSLKRTLNVQGAVLPRELDVDEIKKLASFCPPGLSLEVFVHGALCYGVSGRCYWSSFLGGRSGLRGRCVQPCRRRYAQKGRVERFFSCMDLSIDVLVKVLLSIPEIRTWKIEGRKKGPHYVYHVVKAYRLLRDEGTDPQVKKEALSLLELALGRPGTHYNFLPQRPQNPVRPDVHTGSGLLIGKITGTKTRPYLRPHSELFPGDLLRVGYEDEAWHATHRVKKYVPAKGRFDLNLPRRKSPPKGTAVFLVDRKEGGAYTVRAGSENKLKVIQTDRPVVRKAGNNARRATRRAVRAKEGKTTDLFVYRDRSAVKKKQADLGLWVPPGPGEGYRRFPVPDVWWWLPPVIWPKEESMVVKALCRLVDQGAKRFVLNAPWQIGLFARTDGLTIWAGPFCNLANPLAVNGLASMGYAGAIVSPELAENDFSAIPGQSVLPLGTVLSGNWPLCISRIRCRELTEDTPFQSPKKETAWVKHLDNNYWVFPNWKLDLTREKEALEKYGYRLFVHLVEPLPKRIDLKRRPGLWNWELGLA